MEESEHRRNRDYPGLTRAQVSTARACQSATSRLEWLIDAIAEGSYEHRVTDRSLAEVWGLSRRTVENMLGEAWKFLAINHGPERSEEVRAKLIARVEQIGRQAASRRKEICNVQGDVVSVADPDYRTALAACQEVATLLQVREERHRVSVDPTRLTDGEILEQLKAAGYVVQVPEPPRLAGFESTCVVLTEGEET